MSNTRFLHDDISINDILNVENEIVAFKIQTRFEFGLKLPAVIRNCLGVSATLLNHMIETEAFFTPEGYPLNAKHIYQSNDTINLCRVGN